MTHSRLTTILRQLTPKLFSFLFCLGLACLLPSCGSVKEGPVVTDAELDDSIGLLLFDRRQAEKGAAQKSVSELKNLKDKKTTFKLQRSVTENIK